MSEDLKIGEGWFEVRAGGQTFFGKKLEIAPAPSDGKGEEPEEDDLLILMPCYEIQRIPVQNQGVAIQAVPYGMYPDSEEVTILNPDVVVDIGSVKEATRKMYVQLVKGAETIKTQLRAAQSGIRLA